MKRFLMLVAFVTFGACDDGSVSAPTLTPAAPATTLSAPGTSTYPTQGAAAQLNAIRAEVGLRPVRRSALLDKIAMVQARDMQANNFFSHSGSNGSTVGQRAKRRGYDWCLVAENISKGAKNMTAAIRDWRASRSHYRNMTRRGIRDFGVATAGSYRVMVLGATDC